MRRTDHSMQAPTPAATLAFKSPNACNLCHTNETPAWADQKVRQWHTRDYQAPRLLEAELIAAARRADWRRLPDMLAALQRAGANEIFKTSLIRLLRFCEADTLTPVLVKFLQDASPLVRASATEALGDHLRRESIPALLAASRDEFRLVRIRAAAALASVPGDHIPPADEAALRAALAEYEASLQARPDDFVSHYNLGNYYFQRNQAETAVAAFASSTRLQPDFIPALINASLALNLLGQNDRAAAQLRQALVLSPTNAAAYFNLGLLLGELGRVTEAETALRAALKNDPLMAAAAYNLGVILAASKSEEALTWCRKAAQLQPAEPKYAYTLAFYLQQKGDATAAIQTLRDFADKPTADSSIFELLGGLLEESSPAEAVRVYHRAAANERLPGADRQRFALRAEQLSTK